MIITGLSNCPHCGTMMHMGYACGEHFIFPNGFGCMWCRGYTEMHSTMEQTRDAWNNACERELASGLLYTKIHCPYCGAKIDGKEG